MPAQDLLVSKNELKIHARTRTVFLVKDKSFLGPGRIALLQAIKQSGSLSQAARNLNMSYHKAWHLLSSLNQATPVTLVTTDKGGAGGGGTYLTQSGEKFLQLWQRLERKQKRLEKDMQWQIQNLFTLRSHVRKDSPK